MAAIVLNASVTKVAERLAPVELMPYDGKKVLKSNQYK